MGARERLARLLSSTGVLDAALRLRAAVRVPYLTILTYHHVWDVGDGYDFDPGVADVTPEAFARQLDILGEHFTPVRIDDVVNAFDGGELPPNPALITFDDGYRSCIDIAAPLLAERGMPAVFFIPTVLIDERRLFWWEQIAWLVNHARRRGCGTITLGYPRACTMDLREPSAFGELNKIVKNTRQLDLPRFLDELTAACGLTWDRDLEIQLADELLMTWDQIRALAAAGMDIESHCRRHRVLQTLEPGDLLDELLGSRADLEKQTGRAPQAIAYPVGRPIAQDRLIRDAVIRAGYRLGFTNQSGATWLHRGVDPLNLSRLSMDRGEAEPYFLGKLAIPQLAYRYKPDPVGYKAS